LLGRSVRLFLDVTLGTKFVLWQRFVHEISLIQTVESRNTLEASKVNNQVQVIYSLVTAATVT